jgi:hypothetical protein
VYSEEMKSCVYAITLQFGQSFEKKKTG